MKQIAFILVAAGLAGCSNFRSQVTETNKDGTVKETFVRTYTLFDGKSELTKVSAGQTDKSQRVGVGGVNVESSATNAVRSLELINAIISKAP